MSAVLGLSVALFAVSWSAILIRLCDAPALAIAFFRLLFATLGTLPLAMRARERRDFRPAALWSPALLAGALLAAHFAFWIRSLEMTSVASSVLLVNVHPLLSGFAARRWLGDPLGAGSVAGLLLALGGTAVTAAGDWSRGGSHLTGDLLAVGGAIAVAGYMLVGRSVRRRLGLGAYLTAVYAVATVALGAACLVGEVPLLALPPSAYGWILLMAAGPHLLGHNLLNWAVRRLPAHVVQAAVLGEPILASCYAAWIFGEKPALSWYAGAACLAAGVGWVAREEWVRQSRAAGESG
jgi:drug/metabolite transporter (DMT)-like permease